MKRKKGRRKDFRKEDVVSAFAVSVVEELGGCVTKYIYSLTEAMSLQRGDRFESRHGRIGV